MFRGSGSGLSVTNILCIGRLRSNKVAESKDSWPFIEEAFLLSFAFNGLIVSDRLSFSLKDAPAAVFVFVSPKGFESARDGSNGHVNTSLVSGSGGCIPFHGD